MLLRPRQKTFVERSLAALATHGNTLGVAPTGAGKTIMLSAVGAASMSASSDAKAAVLAHRDELTRRTARSSVASSRAIATSVVDAGEKSWGGQVTFAMVPTLTRAGEPGGHAGARSAGDRRGASRHRRQLSPHHRSGAAAQPDCRIYGVTATPNRGDRRACGEVFSNVADQIRLGELIASGHLVPPRTFVIDVGVQDELRAVRRTATTSTWARSPSHGPGAGHRGGGQALAGKGRRPPDRRVLLDRRPRRARPRRSDAAGAPPSWSPARCRMQSASAVLAAYAGARPQVVVNVAVLTEGWDHPPTSCVVLLRPSSFKSHHDPDGRPRAAHRRSGRASRHRQARLHRARLRHLRADPRLPGTGRGSRRPARRGRGAHQELPVLRGRGARSADGMPDLRPRLRASRGARHGAARRLHHDARSICSGAPPSSGATCSATTPRCWRTGSTPGPASSS